MQVDPNQELLAIGASNFFGSFIGSYAVTGSFSRSAVKNACSVKSTGSSIITGLVVIIALESLTKQFQYIPNAALAAIIIVAGISIVDFKVYYCCLSILCVMHQAHALCIQTPLRIWKVSKIDFLPWLTSFIVVLFAGVE